MPHPSTRHTSLRGGFSVDHPSSSYYLGNGLPLETHEYPGLVPPFSSNIEYASPIPMSRPSERMAHVEEAAPKSFFWRAMEAVVRVAQVLATTQTVTAVFSRSPALSTSTQPEITGALAESTLSYPTATPSWLTDATYDYVPSYVDSDQVTDEIDHADSRNLQTSLSLLNPPSSAYTITANVNTTINLPLSIFTVTPNGFANVSITDQLGNPIPKGTSFANYAPLTLYPSLSLGTSNYYTPGVPPYCIYNSLLPGRSDSDVAFNAATNVLYFAKEEGIFPRSFAPGSAPSMVNGVNISSLSYASGLPSVRPSGAVIALNNNTLHLSGVYNVGNSVVYLIANLTNATAINVFAAVNISQVIQKMQVLPGVTVLMVPNGVVLVDTTNSTSPRISSQLAINNLYDVYAVSSMLVASSLRQMYIYNFSNPYAITELPRPPADNNLFNAPVLMYNTTTGLVGDGNNGFYLKDFTQTSQPLILNQILPWDSDSFSYNTRMLAFCGPYVCFVGASISYVFNSQSLAFLAEYPITTFFPSLNGQIYLEVVRYTVANNLIIQSVITNKGVVHAIIDARLGDLANAAALTVYIDKALRGQAQTYRYTAAATGNPSVNTYFTVTAQAPGPALVGTPPAALTLNVLQALKQYIDLSAVKSPVGDALTPSAAIVRTNTATAPATMPSLSLSSVQPNDYQASNTGWAGTNPNGISIIPVSNRTNVFFSPFVNGTKTHIFSVVDQNANLIASFDLPYIDTIFLNYMSVLPIPSNDRQFIVSYGTNVTNAPYYNGNVSVVTISAVGSVSETVIVNGTFSLGGLAVCSINSRTKLFWSDFVVGNLRSIDITAYLNANLTICMGSGSFSATNAMLPLNNVQQNIVAYLGNDFTIVQYPLGYASPYPNVGFYQTAQNQPGRIVSINSATVCIAQTNVGVLCLDVTSTPVLLGQLTIPSINQVYCAVMNPFDNGILVIGASSAIYIINVDNPAYPLLLMTYPTTAPVVSVMIQNNNAIIASILGQGVFNITAPSSLRNVNYYTISTPISSQGVYNLTSTLSNAYGASAALTSSLTVPNVPPYVNTSLALPNVTFYTSTFQSVVLAANSDQVMPSPVLNPYADSVSVSCSNGLNYVAPGAAVVPLSQALPFLTFTSGPGLQMSLFGNWPPQNVMACQFTVLRDDGKGGLCNRSFFVWNPYQPPVSLSGGYPLFSTTAVVNASISSNAGLTDPNGYPLYCVVVWSSSGISVAVNSATCIPTVSTVSRGQGLNTYIIQATAVGTNGVVITGPLATVNVSGVVDYRNTPPAFPSSALPSGEIAVPYNATAQSATDVDGDPITQFMVPMPSGLSYNTVSGAITGTPGPATAGTNILTRQASDPYSSTTTTTTLTINDPWQISIGQPTVGFGENTPSVAAGSLANLVVSGSTIQPRNVTLYLSNTIPATAVMRMTPSGRAIVSGSGTSAISVTGVFADITASLGTWIVNPTLHSAQSFAVNVLLTVNGASVLPKTGSITFLATAVANPLAVVAQSTTPFISAVPGAINSGTLFSVVDYDGDTVTMNCTIINLNGSPAYGFNISTTVVPVSTQQTGVVYGGTYQLVAPAGAQGTESTTYALVCDAEALDPITGQLIPSKAVRSATTPIIVSDAAASLSGTAPVGAIFYPGHNSSFPIPSVISTIGNTIVVQVQINGATVSWASVSGNTALAPVLAIAPATDASSSYTVTLTYHNSGRSTRYDQSISFSLTSGNAFSTPRASMTFLQNQKGTRLSSCQVAYAFDDQAIITAMIIMPQQFGTPIVEILDPSLVPILSFDALQASYTWLIRGLQSQINPYLAAPPFTLTSNNPTGSSPYALTVSYFTDNDPLFSIARAASVTHVFQTPTVKTPYARQRVTVGQSLQLQVVSSVAFDDVDLQGNFGDFLTVYNNGSLPVGISWTPPPQSLYSGSFTVPGLYTLLPCANDSVGLYTCSPAEYEVTALQSSGIEDSVLAFFQRNQQYFAAGAAVAIPTYKVLQLLYFLVMHAIKDRRSKALLGATRAQRSTWKTEHLEQILTSLRLTTLVIINLMLANYADESATAAVSGTTEDAPDDTTDDSGSEYESLSSPLHAARKTTRALKHGKLLAKRELLTRPGPIEESILVAYAQSTLRSFLKHIMKDVNKDRIGSGFGEKIRYLSMLIAALSYSDPTRNSIPRAFEEDIINYLSRIGALIRSALIDEDADNETRELAHLYLALTHYLFFIKSYQNRNIAIELLISLLSNLLATPGLKKSWFAKIGEALYYSLPCTERPEPLLPAGLNLTLNTTVALLSRFPSDDTPKQKFIRLFYLLKPGHMVFTPTARLWENKVERLRFMAVLALQNKGFLLEILKEYLAIPDDQPHLLKSYEETLSFILSSHDLYHSAASSDDTLLRGARTSLISAATFGIDATKSLIQTALELRRRSFFVSNKELLPCLEDALLKRKGFSDVRSSLQKLILEYHATYNASATPDGDFNEDCKILYIIALKRIAQLPQFETRAAASNALAEKHITVAYRNVFTLRTAASQVERKKRYKSAMVLFPFLAVIRTPSKNTLANVVNPMSLSSSPSVHSAGLTATTAPRNALVAQQLLTHFGGRPLTPGARVSGVFRTVVALPKTGKVTVTAAGAGTLLHRAEAAADDRAASAPVHSKSVRGSAGLWAGGRSGKMPLVATHSTAAEEAKGGVAAGEVRMMTDNPLPRRSIAPA